MEAGTLGIEGDEGRSLDRRQPARDIGCSVEVLGLMRSAVRGSIGLHAGQFNRATISGAAGMTSPTPPAAITKNRRKRQVGWQSRDVVRAAALAMALYWLSRLFWLANPLFLTCFLGVLFGLAVSSGVDRLARFKLPRGAAAGLIVLTFIG